GVLPVKVRKGVAETPPQFIPRANTSQMENRAISTHLSARPGFGKASCCVPVGRINDLGSAPGSPGQGSPALTPCGFRDRPSMRAGWLASGRDDNAVAGSSFAGGRPYYVPALIHAFDLVGDDRVRICRQDENLAALRNGIPSRASWGASCSPNGIGGPGRSRFAKERDLV